MSGQEKVRVSVLIHGRQYTITGTESPDHMKEVAGIVDEKMREINSINPNLNTETLAVLTAVNSIHEYMKLQEEYERILQELNRIKE
ncbi:cell division protein ZapA [Lederbergia galactosidilytica]|uniref:Cell division protein ZapA n=1 Tax=Lederbergia galactosidilytica TaxID=217031 RepID=A0A0Q9Y7M5_9BACI|nr:cell division protein ZapA [Lederbergia galactosidilytica]KRG11491.1 cell division protein ZapA [Lederbergia galactosidilytica]MBP1915010.1 cell division protein ZapA [Lederbergia galactosidilytica]OAK68263.1 cell division protein ZapA [Lederbergia galactosidilytica]